jgi:hypothetical protein
MSLLNDGISLLNQMLHLTLAERWHDLASLSKSGVGGVGMVGAIMMLELVGEWLLSWTGLSGDVLEYQAQLADLLPAEAIKSLVLTSLLVFVPQLLQWLLLLLHLLLQSLNWPRLGQFKPVFSAPAQHDCVLRAANGCRAPPASLSGI